MKQKKACAVALFTKTAELSAVKTRLAKEVGKEKAEQFFDLSTKAVEAVVKKAESMSRGAIQGIWAVAEAEGVFSERWANLPRIWTGEGCLGERQWRVSTTLLKQYETVILMGCDAPQISPHMLLDAYECIKAGKQLGDIVFAPSNDGGYSLIGLGKPLKKELWLAVPYSSRQTYSRFTELLKEHSGNYQLAEDLPPLCDVDEAEDLKQLLKELSAKEASLLPEQKSLLNWIREENLER